MTDNDLAKLASEITQGKWKLERCEYRDGCIMQLEILANGEPLSRINNPNFKEHANYRAFALVPELIAEVLRLREDAEKYLADFKIMNRKICEMQEEMATVRELDSELLRLREENARQKDQLHAFMLITKPGEKVDDICYRHGCTGVIDRDRDLDSVFCPTCEWDSTDDA